VARPRNRFLLATVLCLGLAGSSLSLPGEAVAKERTHEVARGHTLWGIAKRYGVTVAALRAKNDLGDDDKIVPGQTLVIPPKGYKPSDDPPEKKRDEDPPGKGYVAKKPGRATQVQKSSKERGVNPCNTPDPGFGIYDRWSRGITMGQFIMPQKGGVTASGQFDVMFHFHGHEAVRKEWVRCTRTRRPKPRPRPSALSSRASRIRWATSPRSSP
jgi:LysM repeat protein